MNDWPQIKARLERELALCSDEMDGEGWKQFAADIRAALQRVNDPENCCMVHHDEYAALRQRVEELENAFDVLSSMSTMWREENARLRAEVVRLSGQFALLDQAATDYRKARDAAEAKLARVVEALRVLTESESIGHWSHDFDDLPCPRCQIEEFLAAAKGEK